MQISKIIEVLDAEVICCADDKVEIYNACASDMMSDALAFVKDQAMMLTGLINPQSIRTAEMLDMNCIVFVRGKSPSTAMVELAQASGITLLATKLTMYNSCGRLYAAGLSGEAK